MSKLLRTAAALVVAVVAVGQAGCESKNVGLLEDTKWSSAYVPDYKGISLRGMTISLQFHGDGRFHMGLNAPMGGISIHGKWRLGGGHDVVLYDLSQALGGFDTHTETVVIAGDTLTMADSDGTKVVFTKIDQEMERAAKKPVKPSYAPATPPKKSDRELREEGPGSYK